jgi:hypothetical protein
MVTLVFKQDKNGLSLWRCANIRSPLARPILPAIPDLAVTTHLPSDREIPPNLGSESLTGQAQSRHALRQAISLRVTSGAKFCPQSPMIKAERGRGGGEQLPSQPSLTRDTVHP